MPTLWKITVDNDEYTCEDIEMERNRGLLGQSTRLRLIKVQGRNTVENIELRFKNNVPIRVEQFHVDPPTAANGGRR